ncbi:hypothetical protein HK105_206099 [Polyrhizophydium stewartii]|uniref:Uncharacterized protein n=1 Tax=Polyrhizophydium stewartii TaxID=2732419 RepID=A0ABR4N473_9FUNG|nr:hypothetical protein HK105_001960 [Polyrhizophydium stewartii]
MDDKPAPEASPAAPSTPPAVVPRTQAGAATSLRTHKKLAPAVHLTADQRRRAVSPYFSPDNEPVTSGDYEQRIKDTIKHEQRMTPPWMRWGSRYPTMMSRAKSTMFIATTLVVTSSFMIYLANAYVVMQKERRINELLEERSLLRRQRQELLKITGA